MNRVAGALFAHLIFATTLLADFGQPYGYRWERTYMPAEGTGKVFNDLYLLPNGGIAYCGTIRIDALVNHGWLLITSADGNITDQVVFQAGDNLVRRRSVECMTLIQTDDGGFLVGGKTEAGQKSFGVMKVSPQGDIEWSNFYASQGAIGPCCYAVIELKEGDYIVCGQGLINQSFAARINPNGDVVWQRYYQGQTLYAVKEIEDGLAFVNHSSNLRESGLMITDFNGIIVARKGSGPGIPYALIRSPEDGFVISGQGTTPLYGGFALELTDSYNALWRSAVNLNNNAREAYSNAYGIAVNYDGYLMVGNINHPQYGSLATEAMLDLNGHPVWGRMTNIEPDGSQKTVLRSVVTARDGSFIACGGSGVGCVAMAYEPVAHTPYFVELSPADSSFGALVGDTINFRALAEDPDGDEIAYRWKLAGQVVAEDTTVSITFEETGEFIVVCTISDGVFSDSTYWRVRATELYISEHSPDTLNFRLRRNTEVGFSVEARGILPLPYTYQWFMADPQQQGAELVSESQSLFYLFNFVGLHTLSSIVRQGDNRDIITWRILVEAAIARWWPTVPQLEVPLDSSVTFGVVPADSEAVDWRIRWILDDQRIGGQRTETIVFDELGLHELLARVEQHEMIDTVRWYIVVHEPVGVKDPTLFPGEFSYSLSPNPFNDVSQIHLNLPEAAEVRVSLYDSFGRYVRQVENRPMGAGRNRVSFDAGGLPAGVYILRLEAGGHNAMMKAALLR